MSNVDTTDVAAVKSAIIPGKTKLVMLESPTNPRMQVCVGCGLLSPLSLHVPWRSHLVCKTDVDSINSGV